MNRQTKSLDVALWLALLAAMALSSVNIARAALEVIEDAIEVTPRQIEWPTYDQGRLVVRPCRDCETISLTVNDQTGYYLGFNQPGLSRQELISKANNSSSSQNTLVYLFYRPENKQVTRIILDLGPK